jgi:MFS family permease
MQFLLRLPLGILSDRIQKRKLFITGAMISSFAAGIVMFLVPTPGGLLAGRVFAGISACAYVQITVLYSSYYEDSELSKAMGVMVSLMYFGQMIAMLLGGVVADGLGTEYTFLLTSVIALVGLLMTFFVYDKPIDKKPIEFGEIKYVITNRWLIVASLLAILCQGLNYAKGWSFVPLAAFRYGASGLMQSVVTISFTFFSMISAMMAGKFVGYFGEKKTLAIGFLMHGLGSGMIALWQSVGGLVAGQAISGIGNGFIISLLMGISLKTIPSNRRGSAMGLYQALYAIGMFAGPFIFGSFADKYPLRYGFTATAAIAFLGVALVFILLKGSEKFKIKAE